MYCSAAGDISKPWWRLTEGKERVGFLKIYLKKGEQG